MGLTPSSTEANTADQQLFQQPLQKRELPQSWDTAFLATKPETFANAEGGP